jgi:hypothetical protein
LLSSKRVRILLALVLVVAALRVALPFVAQQVIASQASAALGRSVEVDNVDLFLLAGHASIEGLRIGHALPTTGEAAPIDPAKARLALGRIATNVGWLGLVEGRIHVESIEIDGLHSRLALDEQGKLESLVLAAETAPEPEEPEPETPETDGGGGGWPIQVDATRFSDFGLLLVDTANPDVPPFEFGLKELSVGPTRVDGEEVHLGPLGIREPTLRVARDLSLLFGGEAPAQPAEPDAAPESAAEPMPETEPAPDVKPPAELEPESEVATSSPARTLRAADIAIEGADLALDLGGDDSLEVTLHVSADDVQLARGTRFPLTVRLERDEGWIELKGQTGIFPAAFDGSLRWSDFPLIHLIQVASPGASFRLSSGSSSGDLSLKLDPPDGEAPGAAGLSGTLQVQQLRVADDSGTSVVLGSLDLDMERVAVALGEGVDAAPEVSVNALRIGSPEIVVVRTPPTAGAESDDAPEAPEESTAGAASSPPRISIAKLEVRDGDLEFSDETLDPVRTFPLRKVTVTGSGIRMPERQGKLSFSAVGLSGFAIDVDGNLTGTTTASIQKLALMSLSAYCEQAVGVRITSGLLNLDATVDSQGNSHKIDAKADFDRLEIADAEEGAFESAFGTSPDLALSLLRGPGGGISLPLSLSIEEGETSVALSGIIVAAMRQAMLGVATAPLKALGLALRGGGGDDDEIGLEPIAFEAGSAVLGDDANTHAELLAAGLGERDDIAIEIAGLAGEQDDYTLAAALLVERIRDKQAPAAYEEAGLLARGRVRKALERISRLEAAPLNPKDAELVERLIDDTDVPEERRMALARARTEAFRDALVTLHGVPADLLRLVEPREGPPGVEILLAARAR